VANNYPGKNDREDALLLAEMIVRAVANDVTPPLVTPARATLLAATLSWIVEKHGRAILD
jgi:hypothetical protein